MSKHLRNFSHAPAAVLCLAVLNGAAAAQTIALPDLFVTASRLGGGITGASTSIITAEEIERSPGATLQDVLEREPGIQVQNLFGGVAGARTVVDMRGFGATATSNVLVLVNGRRLNDVDMAGVDFAAIPRDSIERIEITRGNSGAVLYGDGAMGGVINIVTKTGVGLPSRAKIGGAIGSFGYAEGNGSAVASSGPLTASAYGNVINSDGYRVNNELRQRNGVGELRYTGTEGTAYFNLSGDTQHLGLPGGRRVTLTSSELVTDRRGAATPFDYADKQGVNLTAGVTRNFANGIELIVDGGVRRKDQQAGFFSSFGSFFDSYFDATLTTYSLTPRAKIEHAVFGLPGHAILGIDAYQSVYDSDRAQHRGVAPYHRYDIDQRTVAGYLQDTINLRPDTDFSFGGRLQQNTISARDKFDPSAPGAFFSSAPVEGLPLDRTEPQYALHAGLEHRLNDSFALFGRAARSFRLPVVDERVGLAPFGTPTNFDLKSQTSHDFEAGYRVRTGGLFLQTSAYLMDLVNEIYFSPATFTNINLDPTRRYGVETAGSYLLTETVRLKAGAAYTRAVFREGPFAGNDVPLVSRFTANAGVSWDVWTKALVLDVVARYVGPRRFDNDARNVQPLIPAHTVVDFRIGGEVDRFFYSVAIQNVFNVLYFDYGIASAFTFGTYNAYPVPGRSVIARAGMVF
jgi:iron complex outermembrane receptor protein